MYTKIFIHGNILEDQTKKIAKIINKNLNYTELVKIPQLKIPNITVGSCTIIRMKQPTNDNLQYGILNYYQIKVDHNFSQYSMEDPSFVKLYARVYLIQNLITNRLKSEFRDISYEPNINIFQTHDLLSLVIGAESVRLNSYELNKRIDELIKSTKDYINDEINLEYEDEY